jgi:hypothetical protein
MLLMLPLGITYFTIVVTGLSVSLATIAAPFLQVLLHQPVFRTWEYGYYIDTWAFPLVVALGVLGFFTTLWISKGIGFLHGMFAKVMLVGRFEREA